MLNILKCIISNNKNRPFVIKGTMTTKGPLILSRPEKAINPLMSYNPTNLTLFNENTFVTIDVPEEVK